MNHRPKRKSGLTQRQFNFPSDADYMQVDDPENFRNVCIFPSRPINDVRYYADRDSPRSGLSPSRPSVSEQGNIHTSPRNPPRGFQRSSGPAVNRDSKPSRRLSIDLHLSPDFINKQPRRYCPPPPPLTSDHQFAGLEELVQRDAQKSVRDFENEKLKRPSKIAENSPNRYTDHKDSATLAVAQRSQSVFEPLNEHEWNNPHDQLRNDSVWPQQSYSEEEWYVGVCSRIEAEHALHLVNKDGAFLIRDCSANRDSEPLVLAVYHEKKVYNVKIRFIAETEKYALGNGQRSNDMFHSVEEIVKFHSTIPIILISGRLPPGSTFSEQCVLKCPVSRRDIIQLL